MNKTTIFNQGRWHNAEVFEGRNIFKPEVAVVNNKQSTGPELTYQEIYCFGEFFKRVDIFAVLKVLCVFPAAQYRQGEDDVILSVLYDILRRAVVIMNTLAVCIILYCLSKISLVDINTYDGASGKVGFDRQTFLTS